MTYEGITPEAIVTAYGDIHNFLEREARFFDDCEFDRWIDCYHPAAECWLPAWDMGATFVVDSQQTFPQHHYSDRRGIEEQASRIRSAYSSEIDPLHRTVHSVMSLSVVDRHNAVVEVQFDWLARYIRGQRTDSFLAVSYCTIDCTGTQPVIVEKKITPQRVVTDCVAEASVS